MYKRLTNKLSDIISRISSKNLSKKDIDAALIDIESAFIDADVAHEAIVQFKQHISTHTQNLESQKGLDAKSQLMHLVRNALLSILSHDEPLPTFHTKQLQIVLMVGLQGAGKTTTCAKITNYIKKTTPNVKVMLASVDIYRPQAIAQLRTLAHQVDATFHPHHDGTKPLDICTHAIDHAKKTNHDVLIIDTAGRLDIDQERMAELDAINRLIKPQHTLYVVDSMMGQSALNTAKAFNDTVNISGIILSKLDSDTKGGVALSIRTVIQKPIHWVGMGEGLDKLEPFNPKRITDQLLDMGDIIGLAEKAQKHIDEDKAKKMSKRLHKGQFSLDDMLQQILQIHQMGGMTSILKMLPGSAKIPDNILKMIEDDTKLQSIQSLIQSMTPGERLRPELVRNQPRRQQRILKGCGRSKSDINELFKAYDKMKKMTEKLKGGKMKAMMQQFAKSDQMPWGE